MTIHTHDSREGGGGIELGESGTIELFYVLVLAPPNRITNYHEPSPLVVKRPKLVIFLCLLSPIEVPFFITFRG